MKMKQSVAAVAGASILTLASATYASPTLYGSLGARSMDQDNQDHNVEGYDIRLGVKGAGKYADITALYEVEIEYTPAANDHQTTPDNDNEIIVRSARLMFPTQYGTFVIAPKSPSSQFSVLYGAVDIFETNSAAKNEGPALIFDQEETSTHVLAYASPRKAGFKGLVSYLTAGESNGVDGDYITWWLDWTAEKETALAGFRTAVGQVYIDKKAVHTAATEDCIRSVFTASYDISGFHFGGTYEDYDFKGFGALDRSNYGVVASYTLNGYTLGVGRYDRDFVKSDINDNRGTVISLKKQVDENLLFFVENGNFSQDGQSSFSAGAKLKF